MSPCYSIQLHTHLEILTDDAIAQLYVTKFSTISLYLTKLYAKQSFAIASLVKFSGIRQNFYKVCMLRYLKNIIIVICLFSSFLWAQELLLEALFLRSWNFTVFFYYSIYTTAEKLMNQIPIFDQIGKNITLLSRQQGYIDGVDTYTSLPATAISSCKHQFP